MHTQFIALQGMAQCADQFNPLARVFGQLLSIEGKAFAAVALGLEQGRVDIAQHLLDALRVVRKQADADAGGDEQLMAIESKWRIQRVEQLLCELGGLLSMQAILAEHGKLVATQAGQGHAGAQLRAQAFADGLEQQVADIVAEAFVDMLEVVQIDKQHRATVLLALGSLQGMGDALGEQQSVGQVAQRVMVREVVELVLRALERADVGEHRDVMTDTPLFVVDRPDALPLRIDFAILAPIPHLSAPGSLALQGLPQRSVEGGIVTSGFQQAGLPAQALELELTESLLVDDTDHILQQLSGLSQLGVTIAIDDFGTGYSNLSYLRRFNASTLKIDRSFISTAAQWQANAPLVQAIIQMAASLGLTTIAEGIENEEVISKLQALGCTEGQGYYWSPAVAIEQLPALFSKLQLQAKTL